MSKIEQQYLNLLKDILENGRTKNDRTRTGTISVFGRQLRHDFRDGFPLLTTKRMAFKAIVTELLWFLRGDTNIKYLVDNNCHIWDGDAYKNYEKWWKSYSPGGAPIPLSKEEFINKIKTDDEFAKKWGELGPIYGKQWRKWGKKNVVNYDLENVKSSDKVKVMDLIRGGSDYSKYDVKVTYQNNSIDQIANLINDLKTNPNSRRLMVNAWNVGELDQMVLPPCHYGFQVYTRELSHKEKVDWVIANCYETGMERYFVEQMTDEQFHNDYFNTPKRAISLMWNQRSVDTFLGLPFNIASYGLLLEIIAKAVNMVPDELIGNLGDTHLYLNHIEQAKEQIGREMTWEERRDIAEKTMDKKEFYGYKDEKTNQWKGFGYISPFTDPMIHYWLDDNNIPKRTREPFPLPTLNINTEFWPYEGGECGVGPLDAIRVFESFKDDNFCKCLLEEDIQLSNYQSHPTIKAPLSN
jgi:thymidylate synthase